MSASTLPVFQRMPIAWRNGSPNRLPPNPPPLRSCPKGSTLVVVEVTNGPYRGRRFEFREHASFIVGRGAEAHFRLPRRDPYFSRIHFLIEVNPPRCRLVDLASRNGTRLNGQRVEAADLHDGDRILAGDTALRVRMLPSGEPPPSLAGEPSATPAPIPPPLPEPPTRAEEPEVRPPESPELPQIPDCRTIRELGRGGMGIVYLGQRIADNAPVAIKTIRPVRGTSAREIERFLRECQILRTLRHPAIVGFQHFGHTGQLLYLVMDYVPGRDAGRLLRAHRRLAIPLAVNLICQALDGLQHAHRQGFVHRDLKPANLLVMDEETSAPICRVADFGLSRRYQASRISGLTLLGDVGGTIPYMAPEQILDFRNALPAVDIYSAAATLYHLLTGRYVFDFASREVPEKLKRILTGAIVPIRQRRSEIPAELAAAIQRGLARDPHQRFRSADEFSEGLTPFTR